MWWFCWIPTNSITTFQAITGTDCCRVTLIIDFKSSFHPLSCSTAFLHLPPSVTHSWDTWFHYSPNTDDGRQESDSSHANKGNPILGNHEKQLKGSFCSTKESNWRILLETDSLEDQPLEVCISNCCFCLILPVSCVQSKERSVQQAPDEASWTSWRAGRARSKFWSVANRTLSCWTQLGLSATGFRAVNVESSHQPDEALP